MTIESARKKSGMSIYKLSQLSGVPYTTVYAICTGRRNILNCSFDVVQRLACTLAVKLDDLTAPAANPQNNFDTFRSTECHLANKEPLAYIKQVVLEDRIDRFMQEKQPACAMYVLSMVDYLCRAYNIPLWTKYDALRHAKLAKPVYPSDVVLLDELNGSKKLRAQCRKAAIPEFKSHNIMEVDIKNVI